MQRIRMAWERALHQANEAFDELSDEANAAQAKIAELENELVITRAQADAVGSLLLEMQQECIALRNKLEGQP